MDPEQTLARAVSQVSEAREHAATWNKAMDLSIRRTQELEAENAQLRARNAELESEVGTLRNILERMSDVVDEFFNLIKAFSGC